MVINTHIGNILDQDQDAIVVNLFEGVEMPSGATGAMDSALDGGIRKLISGGDFKGKLNQTAVLYPGDTVGSQRIILVGLGEQGALTMERVRQASATAAKKANDLGVRRLGTILHGTGAGGLETEGAAQGVVEGSILGTYVFSDYKTDQVDGQSLEELTLVEFDDSRQKDLERGAEAGRIISEGTCLARDLASMPGNDLTPSALADRAQQMASQTGLKCEIFDEGRIAEEGMRTIEAVAQGSAQPPRFIVLEHEGDRPDSTPVVIIGKGITFDTGGISIKGSDGMWDMKFDMGGAAATIGAMQAIARLGLPVGVIGLVAAAENMPGSRALKPGDIVKSMCGKTIEIRSTDAEGRLVLADAVTYAARLKPAAAIDLATLTGACVTALGHEASGLMSNNDALADEVSAAGDRTGEIAWRLPILEGHRDLIKSDVADIKNTGGSPGGALTGGAFIEAFVQEFPWAHLDIAGTAWIGSDRPYIPKGGTGVGVRLLVDFVRNRT